MDWLAASVPKTRALPPEEPRRRSRLSAFVEGFSLQAGTHVHHRDRAGLEHLCAYGARPPLALTRLSRLENGHYSYALKYPLPDGSLRLLLTGQALMSRLALLVPRPRLHLVRYHGVFASNSNWRPYVVPESEAEEKAGPEAEAKIPKSSTREPPLVGFLPEPSPALSGLLSEGFVPAPAPNPRARYLDWASLLRRVFSEDVLVCTNCGGTRRIIAFIEDPTIAHRILDHLGLPTTGPPRAPARAPIQAELFA